MTGANYLEEFSEEARERLGEAFECRVQQVGSHYRVTARKGDVEAVSGIRKDFVDEYLRSGKVDCCDCVEHFFVHLADKFAD